MTDNGNFICDLHFEHPLESPEQVDAEVRQLPGVMELGLFLDIAGRVLIGYTDGHVEIEA